MDFKDILQGFAGTADEIKLAATVTVRDKGGCRALSAPAHAEEKPGKEFESSA